MSRPFVLALLGAVLAAATFVSMRAAGERAQAEETPSAPTVKPAQKQSSVTAAPTKPAPSKTAPSKVAPATPKSTTPKAPAKPKAKPKPAATTAGVPPKVQRALQAKRVVVLFFHQPGADDAATQSAVRSLHGKKGVAVFSDGITHLPRYRRVVAGLGITQAPSVVIVGKNHKARLIEGYVDGGTLTQQVLDAR
jgi:outer membrane biosynthesis protein TonB